MKTCLYEYNTLPPCVSFETTKYSYLVDFLNDEPKGQQSQIISHSIGCINVHDSIHIKESNCINCMFCLFLCPGHKITINDHFSLQAKCSDFNLESDGNRDFPVESSFFQSEVIHLPKLKSRTSEVKYKHFEDFTGVRETQNISAWGAGALRFLMKGKNPRLGLEVGMKVKTRLRGARLDITIMSGDIILFAEAKISFRKMMEENRYLSQLIAYEEEIKSIIPSVCPNKRYYKFLLIGGIETDLLPPNHADCTSNVGNNSEIFYNNVVRHNLYFISANALLFLGLQKISFGDKYSIDNLENYLFKKGVIGLLSCGLVFYKDSKYFIEPLPIFDTK